VRGALILLPLVLAASCGTAAPAVQLRTAPAAVIVLSDDGRELSLDIAELL